MEKILDFELSSEPPPIPSMSSDDEDSFVVLGNSFMHSFEIPSHILEANPELRKDEKELTKTENPSDISQQLEDVSLNTMSSELPHEEIQNKIDSLIAENANLREIVIKNNLAMESQHKKILEWRHEVQKTHMVHKQKFEEAKEFIQQLKSEKEHLEQELEKSTEIKKMHEMELFKLKDQLKQEKEKLLALPKDDEESKYKLQEVKQNEEWKKLTNDLLEAKKEIKELVDMISSHYCEEISSTKISEFNNDLKQKDTHIDELNSKLKETEVILKQHSDENDALKASLCSSITLQDDLKIARKQLMNAQITITDLQTKNITLKKQIEEKETSGATRDNYYALQQQAEQYKSDFEAERKAKESLKAEKEQIINDFLQIQKRNHELNEEIDSIKKSGFDVLPSTPNAVRMSPSKAGSTHSSERQSPSPNRYECPICNLKYRSIKLLEQHVETCIPEPNWL